MMVQRGRMDRMALRGVDLWVRRVLVLGLDLDRSNEVALRHLVLLPFAHLRIATVIYVARDNQDGARDQHDTPLVSGMYIYLSTEMVC